ncbi:MAG: PKD domain-containing protein, partial [Solirubrobacterales bacterium]
LVSPGVYYETINFGGKNITVTSTDPNDRGIVGYTIINADGDGSVVTFENNETNQAVLAGFTITGGVGTVDYEYGDSYYSYKRFVGGGIVCNYSASPTITRCVITRNHTPYYQTDDGVSYSYAYSYGGGIYCPSYGAVITHNTIYNNSAYGGGGLYASSSAVVSNNVIYNNSAAYGGGVYAGYCYLINNTIVNNDVSKEPEWGQGGNVYIYFDYGATNVMANNLVCGAKSGGGVFYYQGHDDVIRFNNVWDNSPANYGTENPRTSEAIYDESADWTGRYGNISVNPQFRNASMNNFHLAVGSPCISAGDPNAVQGQCDEDIDCDARTYAKLVDIGADEFIGYVQPLADAGADQHKLTPEPITLDAGGSYFSDPNGTRTYQWRQTQGAAVDLSDVAAERPAFTPPSEGWYVFELIVGDGQSTSKADRVLVVIGNEAPVADAGPDTLWATPGYVMLDGSRSSDVDPPDELTYTWKQIEGPVALQSWFFTEPNSPQAYFSCETPGVYVFELTVSDGFVTSAADTVRIEAAPFTSNLTQLTIVASESEDYEYFEYPMVSGAKLVLAAGDYTDSTWNIRCVDLESGRIDNLSAQSTDTMPDMDGDLIVWTTGPGGDYEMITTSVAVGNIVTGKVSTLATRTGSDSYGYPAISGNKAVWLHHRSVNTGTEDQYNQAVYDICGADITDPANPVRFTIAEKVGRGTPYPYTNIRRQYEKPLDISGNLVVWEADGDIYGADISDLSQIKVFPICTAAETQSDPSISDHTVVWTDQRNDIGDIYGADISDPDHIREFEVYVASGPQSQPDIDGALVAFVYGTSTDVGSIYLCCVTRGYGVISLDRSGWYYGASPKVDGSTVVWYYYDQVQGMTVDFGYGLQEGPIQNVTIGLCYDYIQHAIDAAAQGDVIVVPPGTYNEKIRLKGKSITLTSSDPNDPAVVASTILTGPGQRVMFADDETADCVFKGFTVTGGAYGLFCSGAAPTISNCVVTDNRCSGVKIWNKGNPTVLDCEIAGNGIGVEMWANTENRMVLNNYGTFRNCLIVGNDVEGVDSGYPTLQNCTVADNLGIGVDAVLAKITNSIIYFNGQNAEGVNLQVQKKASTVTYSDVQGGWAGEGNLDADPLFVAGGDYHLQSQGWSWNSLSGAWAWDDVTSPCIDAGDPASAIGEEPLCEEGDPLSERAGVNTRIDMGAYGGTAQTSLAPRSDAAQQ